MLNSCWGWLAWLEPERLHYITWFWSRMLRNQLINCHWQFLLFLDCHWYSAVVFRRRRLLCISWSQSKSFLWSELQIWLVITSFLNFVLTFTHIILSPFPRFDHPRFGLIKSIRTLKRIRRDEELTVEYGYDHHGLGKNNADAPHWYKSQLKWVDTWMNFN